MEQQDSLGMDPAIPVSEIRSIRHDFTAKEIYDLSLSLAEDNQAHIRLEEEAKAIKSQLKARGDEIQARINLRSSQIKDGFEMRNVKHDVTFNFPHSGEKTLKNTITGESFVEKMQEEEWNLFNQPRESTEDGEPVTKIVFDKPKEKSLFKADDQEPLTEFQDKTARVVDMQPAEEKKKGKGSKKKDKVKELSPKPAQKDELEEHLENSTNGQASQYEQEKEDFED